MSLFGGPTTLSTIADVGGTPCFPGWEAQGVEGQQNFMEEVPLHWSTELS